MTKKSNRKDFLNRKAKMPAKKEIETLPNALSLLDKPSIGFSVDMNLTGEEEVRLQNLLVEFSEKGQITEKTISENFNELRVLTQEIKSIAAQSVILHGERIKKAQHILKNYKHGAFTKWVIQTYGNRTTPYSMLHFYDLYTQLNPQLQEKYKVMPKRAAYTLAQRSGNIEKKEEIVQQYKDQNQKDLIKLIQQNFPLNEKDGRKQKKHEKIDKVVEELSDLVEYLCENLSEITELQKKKIHTNYLLLRSSFSEIG